MFKKFRRSILVGVVVISMIASLGIVAKAQVMPSFGGWWVNWGSITVEWLLKHVRNVEVNPVWVEVTLYPDSGNVDCLNQGGNATNANGVPFHTISAGISATAGIDPTTVTKNGKSLDDIEFEQSYLEYEVFPDLNQAEICQNANWYFAPDSLVVTAMAVTYYAWQDGQGIINDDGVFVPNSGETPADDVYLYCWLPSGAVVGDLYDCYTCEDLATIDPYFQVVEGRCEAPADFIYPDDLQ